MITHPCVRRGRKQCAKHRSERRVPDTPTAHLGSQDVEPPPHTVRFFSLKTICLSYQSSRFSAWRRFGTEWSQFTRRTCDKWATMSRQENQGVKQFDESVHMAGGICDAREPLIAIIFQSVKSWLAKKIVQFKTHVN